MVAGQAGYASLAPSMPGVDEWRASGGTLQAAQRLCGAGGALHAHAQRLGDPGVPGLPPQQVPITFAIALPHMAAGHVLAEVELHTLQPTHLSCLCI